MEAIDALAQSSEELARRLRLVQSDQWELPTPCEEWNVRDLVNHVLLGTRMSGQLLSGMARDEVIAGLNDDLVAGADPIATFDELAAAMQAGFAAESGLDGTVDHPMGEIPRTQFIGFRVCDNTAHAWDLARALGADEQLDDELIEFAWEDMQPMKDVVAQIGIFGSGASGSVGDNAPLQNRYLDLIGRRP